MDFSDLGHLHVNLEEDGRVAVLRLDHGKANEMGRDQVHELLLLTRLLAKPGGPQALISYSDRKTRRGTPIFISGANVRERQGWSDEAIKEHVRWQRRVITELRRAPVFHVAVVSGAALGWGTEFMLACDYRLACDNATFGLPETGLGIIPGAGGTSELWAHIGAPQALRLGMTGERISANEAHRIGLVQERVSDLETGLARARNLAEQVARRSPTAVAAFKLGVLSSIGVAPELRHEEEARAYEHCIDCGEAALGREHFDTLVRGGAAPWGTRVRWRPLS
jgi:enoyl-CoA hydratase/carnithine racemase